MAYGRIISPSATSRARVLYAPGAAAVDNERPIMIQSSQETGRTLITEDGSRLFDSMTQKEGVKMSQTNKKTGNCKDGIVKRGKTYSYFYYLIDPITGKKKQKQKGGFATRKEAQEAKAKADAEIQLGQYHEPAKMTVGEYITDWFHTIHKQTLTPNSARGYEVNIRVHIVPNIGSIPLSKLTRNDIMRMYNKLSESRLKPDTVRYVHNTLSKGLREAVLSDIIPKNPCDGAKLPKRIKHKATVLNNVQCGRILEAAKQSKIELELLLAITLGLRRGEILGLTLDDFDFDTGTVHIQKQITSIKSSKETGTGKTEWGFAPLKTAESNRILYPHSLVMEAVKARRAQIRENRLRYGSEYRNLNLVCCNDHGDPTNPYTFRTEFNKLLKQLDLPHMRIHDLRHTYATAMIESNVVPLKAVSYSLGHSSIGITADIYCDVINGNKELRNAADQCFFKKTKSN